MKPWHAVAGRELSPTRTFPQLEAGQARSAGAGAPRTCAPGHDDVRRAETLGHFGTSRSGCRSASVWAFEFCVATREPNCTWERSACRKGGRAAQPRRRPPCTAPRTARAVLPESPESPESLVTPRNGPGRPARGPVPDPVTRRPLTSLCQQGLGADHTYSRSWGCHPGRRAKRSDGEERADTVFLLAQGRNVLSGSAAEVRPRSEVARILVG